MRLIRLDVCNKLATGISRARWSSKVSGIFSDQDRREFADVFPQIVRDLTENEEYADVPQANKWFAKVLECNVSNGNKNKSSIVPLSYKVIEDPNLLTRENTKLADILGWCFEINQSSILILDDIYDSSETRRGVQSWHKLNGLRAVNDSVFLENCVFQILKRYFSKHPSYVSLVEMFREIMLIIAMSQTLEDAFINEGKSNMDTITLKRYNILNTYKSEPYAFLFPIKLAMHLAKKFDPVACRKLEPILRGMANLLQVTNDFSDCYGSPDDTGKIGTDIQEGKFSWLITVAMERASVVQKKILSENYGRSHFDAASKVKEVYDELDMRSVFAKHEEQKLKVIRNQIRRMSEEKFPHALLLEYLGNIVEESNWKQKLWWYS